MEALRADLRANKGHPKEQFVLVSLRLSQWARARSRRLGTVATLVHRLITEVIYGIELRPETSIGGGLRLFHGYATVVHTGAVLGSGVSIHQSVTIGLRHAGGQAPVLGDNVNVGASALILGGVHIGDGATIGAGAVVLNDVPAGRVAVGNPARILPSA
ncbi:serine O-acetyltransferase [Blastococcus sp. SYSU DS0552]